MPSYSSCRPATDSTPARGGVCPDTAFGAKDDVRLLHGSVVDGGTTTVVAVQRPLRASDEADQRDVSITPQEPQDWVWAHGALRPGSENASFRLTKHKPTAFGSLLKRSLAECPPPCAPLGGGAGSADDAAAPPAAAAVPAPAAAGGAVAPSPVGGAEKPAPWQQQQQLSSPPAAAASPAAALRPSSTSAPALGPAGAGANNGPHADGDEDGVGSATLVGGGVIVRWKLQSEGNTPGVLIQFVSLRVRGHSAAHVGACSSRRLRRRSCSCLCTFI